MLDILRDAPFGQLVRLLTNNKVFSYPEERDDFSCPLSYRTDGLSHSHEASNTRKDGKVNKNKDINSDSGSPSAALETDPEKLSDSSSDDIDLERQATLSLQRTKTLPFTADRLEIERKIALEKTKSRDVVPVVTSDGTVLADWYNTDDPANPQNWSQKKKAFVALQVE